VADAFDILAQLNGLLNSLVAVIERSGRKIVSPSSVQPTISAIARIHFESVRPELTRHGVTAALVKSLDDILQELIVLGSEINPPAAYSETRSIAPLFLKATIELAKARGEQRLVLSHAEQNILRRLEGMLPVSADSYEQAIRDIVEGGKVSWRGTATELREVLREVIHHLAPTEDVIAAPGYAHEEGQNKPTQRQRVRHILTTRHSGDAALASAEGALTTVDEMVALLARTTYNRSSASTHGGTGATEIRNLKGYIDALLSELLTVGAEVH
jgi:hypothetical protein